MIFGIYAETKEQRIVDELRKILTEDFNIPIFLGKPQFGGRGSGSPWAEFSSADKAEGFLRKIGSKFYKYSKEDFNFVIYWNGRPQQRYDPEGHRIS